MLEDGDEFCEGACLMVEGIWGGVVCWEADGHEEHGFVIFREVKLGGEAAVWKEVDPASTQALVPGFEHHVGGDNGGVLLAAGDAVLKLVVPGARTVVANEEYCRRVKGKLGHATYGGKGGVTLQDIGMHGLGIARGRCHLACFEHAGEGRFGDGGRFIGAHGVACLGKIEKIVHRRFLLSLRVAFILPPQWRKVRIKWGTDGANMVY